MKKAAEWIFLFAALLAILAFVLGLYRSLFLGRPMDRADLVFPAILAGAILIMWRSAAVRRREGGDAS